MKKQIDCLYDALYSVYETISGHLCKQAWLLQYVNVK